MVNDKDLQEIFLNQHIHYLAGLVYESYEAARNGCGNTPHIKTIKFVRAPEEPENIEDPKSTEDPEEETTE